MKPFTAFLAAQLAACSAAAATSMALPLIRFVADSASARVLLDYGDYYTFGGTL